MSDETLAYAPPTAEAAVEMVDLTVQPKVEDFDFEEFLAGARPTRRAVKVYARADLVGAMDELAGEFRDDMKAAEKKRIRDGVQALIDEFEASARWFVVEARSQERIVKVYQDSAAARGIALPADDATGDEAKIASADHHALELDVLADAVVSPKVTGDGLARMEQRMPTEFPKLLVAQKNVNTQLARSAGVFSRDFSPEPSGKSGTAGSKRR